MKVREIRVVLLNILDIFSDVTLHYMADFLTSVAEKHSNRPYLNACIIEFVEIIKCTQSEPFDRSTGRKIKFRTTFPVRNFRKFRYTLRGGSCVPEFRNMLFHSSMIWKFPEIQTRIFYRMESAIVFRLVRAFGIVFLIVI